MAAAKNEREGLKHDYRKLGVVGDIRGGSGRRSRESGGPVFGLLGSSIDLGPDDSLSAACRILLALVPIHEHTSSTCQQSNQAPKSL